MKDASQEVGARFERMCLEKNIPLRASLELTYRCNLRCRHCYIPKERHGELSREEIEPILDQLAQMGTMFLTLTGGEIATRDDFLDIAGAAKQRGFVLTLMTNGTLMANGSIDEIAKLKPRAVHISLYGACSETHDYVTTVPGSFERTVKAIKGLVKHDVHVKAKTVLMHSNVGEHKEIKALAQSLGADPVAGISISPGKDGSKLPLQHRLSPDDMEFYFTGESKLPGAPDSDFDPMRSLLCKAGRSTCSISPDGRVFPCLLTPLALGSLKEQTMSDIWHQKGNELLDRLRMSEAYESSPCLRCDLLPLCNRCPGVAYTETGDLFGPSPSACRRAELMAKTRNSHLESTSSQTSVASTEIGGDTR